MIICPNLSNPEVAREFNELVQATSELAAYHIWSLNNGNAIDRAPNGAPSKLFLTLLEHYNGDRTKAIQAKAKTYGTSFLLWFGDWTGNYEESLDSDGVTKEVLSNGKIRLSLPTHTEEHPRQIVLEPQGDNKYYVHMRIWDGEKVPCEISDEDKRKLFNALYKELPAGAEILFPKSEEGYYGTRGTVAGLMRLAKDKRFAKGSEGVLLYKDKDGSVKEYRGTSFIKIDMLSTSKVVDENGEPLVVYHGSSVLNFTVFELQREAGFHFGSKAAAESFGETRAFFLNIKNIGSYDDNMWFGEKFLHDFVEDGTLTKEEADKWREEANDYAWEKAQSYDYRYYDGQLGKSEYINKKIQELKGSEYGIFYINTSEDPGHISYIVFNPNQIKSIDNEGSTPYEGTFSRENDDIYYQILTDSEYSEMIEELELSRDSTDSFIYNFVTKILRVKPNYKFNENSSDSVWYAYASTNVDPSYTNRERTEKLIRKIFGYDANIVFNDRQSLIESINEELSHWVENLKNIIENPLDLSDFYKKRSLILLRIEDLRRYNKGKLSLNDVELQQILHYIDVLNSNAGKYSKLTESQRIGYEIVKLRKELLSLEQQIRSLIFKRHSIIISAKNRLIAINTIDNIQDLIRNRILLEYEAYQPKEDFINLKILPFENLLKKIKKATLSTNYENRTDDLINLDQQIDITYDELYKIVTKNHQEFANLIELFRSANPDLKIKIGGDPEIQLGGVVPGKFHPKSNTLTLYNGCDVYTIIHELAHSATFFGIFGKSEKSEEFSKKIEMFMNYIRKYISDNKLNPTLFRSPTIMGVSLPASIYGFTNESEFIAELYGNPSFLDLLDSIPPMNKKEFNSLLQEFIHTIIEFFNNLLGKNRIHKSALDLAKELGLISIKLQKDHIEDIYRQLHDINNDNFNNLLNNFLLQLPNEYGDYFGWSIESITNHLIDYVINSTGRSDVLAKKHVKNVNQRYGTNFGVYRRNGVRMLKYNTKPIWELKLTENPNKTKSKDTQLDLFDDNKQLLLVLKNLGQELMNKCKG